MARPASSSCDIPRSDCPQGSREPECPLRCTEYRVTRRIAFLLFLFLAGVSCVPAETSAYRRTPGPTSGGAAASGAAVGIQRDPADLPVLPGESAVMSAFAR